MKQPKEIKSNVNNILKSVGRANASNKHTIKDSDRGLSCHKLKCKHGGSKNVWASVGTKRVRRNGNGVAIKTVEEQCSICGKKRTRDVHFTDMRIIHSK